VKIIKAASIACICLLGACSLGADIETMREQARENTKYGVKVPGDTFAKKLEWLENNVRKNTKYTIEIRADETMVTLYDAVHDFNYGEQKNITVTLMSDGEENRTITNGSAGSLFRIGEGNTLILDKNITLKGGGSNSNKKQDKVIDIWEGGALIMNEGSAIIDNNVSLSNHPFGGAVHCYKATFTMNGGTISGCTAQNGGAVLISGEGATFTMNGGTISGNTATFDGGGVNLGEGATFTMNGGTISGNIAQKGGAVTVWRATFTMNDGTISGNTATMEGGGVDIMENSFFTKTGGTIYGYSASDTKSNVVKNNDNVYLQAGHAVFAWGNGITKFRDNTAGTGVNLSFYGKTNSFTGIWNQ